MEEISNKRRKFNHQMEEEKEIRDEITCWGCREDQPNQLAHIDYGGCLYTSEEDYSDLTPEEEES